MLVERFTFIQKGPNSPVEDSKTINLACKEAMKSPQNFIYQDFSQAIPSKEADLLIGFIKESQFEQWINQIGKNVNWVKKSQVFRENRNKEQPNGNTAKLNYLGEIYYRCSLLGTYESQRKTGAEARYKNVRASSVKTGCRCKIIYQKARMHARLPSNSCCTKAQPRELETGPSQ